MRVHCLLIFVFSQWKRICKHTFAGRRSIHDSRRDEMVISIYISRLLQAVLWTVRLIIQTAAPVPGFGKNREFEMGTERWIKSVIRGIVCLAGIVGNNRLCFRSLPKSLSFFSQAFTFLFFFLSPPFLHFIYHLWSE